MRSSLNTAVVLIAAACVSLFAVRDVRANAPVDQYDSFMPGDGWIHDMKTGLYWQRRVDPAEVLNQAAAVAACADVDGGGKWRLPTYKELMTLVDDELHDEYENGAIVQKAIDREAFPGTPAAKFWTSTKSTVSPGNWYFTIDFGNGMASNSDEGDPRLVRCVADTHPGL
jgi:hypothetical protein